MASPLQTGPSAKTETSAFRIQAKSGQTKQRGRLRDNDGWGGIRGYMNAKKQKRDEQFNQGKTARNSAMFAGVAVYVNGYTNPSSDELRRMLQQNGGRYEMYLSKTRVTHIVATNLPNSKYRLAETIPVVKPEWITDSVAAGKRLSHIPYLLLGNRSKLQSGLKNLAPVSTAVKTVLEFKANPAAHGFDSRETRNVKVETVEPQVNCDVKFLPDKCWTDSCCEVKHAKMDGQSEIVEVVSQPKVKLNASDNVSIINDDDDVVYNSEEDNNNQEDKSRITVAFLSQKDVSPYKKRSRVYSFRKIRKSDSGSFDAHGVDSSSSCDGFIEGCKSGLLDCGERFSHKVEPSLHAVPVKYSNCDTSSGTVSLQRNLNMTEKVNSVGDKSPTTSCLSHASAEKCEPLHLQSECSQIDPDGVMGLQTECFSQNRETAESNLLNTPDASLPAVSIEQVLGDKSATSSVSGSEKSHLVPNSTSRQVSCTSESSHSVLGPACLFLKQTSDRSPATALDQMHSSSRESSHQPSATLPDSASEPANLSLIQTPHRSSATLPDSALEPANLSVIQTPHRSSTTLPDSASEPANLSLIQTPHRSSATLPDSALEPANLSVIQTPHRSSATLPDSALEPTNLSVIQTPRRSSTTLPDSASEQANLSVIQTPHRSSAASCAPAIEPAHPSTKQTFPRPSASTATAKAGDRNFLSEYYSNSRLHHIATWGAEFKAYVSEIQKLSSHSFPGRENLRQLHVENVLKLGHSDSLFSARHGSVQKTVMHIDMDCFFVSVGLLTRPELKGKPVAVTHSRGQGAKPNPDSNFTWERDQWMKKRSSVHLKGLRTEATEHVGTDDPTTAGNSTGGNDIALGTPGNTSTFQSLAEIASCSYEARKAGVKNGMFVGAALNLCPGLLTIPYNFSEYNRVSRILYDVVASYTHDIEAVSCDEMLIDCSDVLSDTGASAMEFAQALRAEILEKTGCSSSVGIGPNILLARLATRRAKPNGQFEVTITEAKEFIKDQLVSDLPGVGYSMCRKLTLLEVHTCGDLQRLALSTLKQEFGPKTGEMLHRFGVGQDVREIKGDKQRKSVSAEVNYGIRFSKETEAVTFLQDLSSEVKRRMDAIGVKGRSITLKLMVRRPDAPVETAKFMGHGICNTFNKSSNLLVATSDEKVIAREVISLYRAHRVVASDMRGIGIQINKLERAGAATGALSRPRRSGYQDITSFTVQKTSNTTTTTDLAPAATATSTTTTTDSALGATATFTTTTTASALAATASSTTTTTDSALTATATTTTNTTCVTMTCCKTVPTPSSRTSPSGSSTSFTAPYTSLRSSRRELSAKVNSENINLLFKDQSDSVQTINFATRAKLLTANSENYHDIPGPSWKVDFPESSTNEGQKFDDNTSFLSESQIDSDVLQELPAEIAQEILEELRVRKQRKQSLPAVTPAQVPVHASNSRNGSLPAQGSGRCAEGADFHGGLPSLSQLDLSCFHALPWHLQDELRAEYGRQEVTSQRSADKKAALAEGNPTHSGSPSKNNRGKQTNAGLKNARHSSKRGRLQGKRALNFGNSKVRSGRRGKDHQMDEKARVPYVNSGVVICIDDDDASSSRDIYANEDSSDREHLPAVSRHVHGSEVPADYLQPATLVRTGQAGDRLEDLTFCGANSLGDVRKLMKEWMVSCPEPQGDDVSMVTEYLIKLVQYRNLEQVYGLLRFLTRKRTSQSNSGWEDSLLNIITCVQSVICACYGATLKL